MSQRAEGIAHRQHLDIQGLFWLATKPDHRVAGRLQFDGVDLGRLDLIGQTLVDTIPGEGEVYRIQGEAGSKELTLDQCQLTRMSHGWFTSDQSFRVGVIVSGALFEEDESLEFNAAILELRFLEHWLGRSGVEWKGTPYVNPTEYQMTYSPVVMPKVQSQQRELQLRQSVELTTESFGGDIKEIWQLVVVFPSFQSLSDIERTCSALENLITIGVDAPSHVQRLGVSHSSAKRIRRLASGVEIYDPPAELYLPRLGFGTQQEARAVSMLFDFDDIGGLEGIDRWLDIASKYEVVIGSLVSHWYIPEIYVENRFFNIYTAAESFVRIKLNEQNLEPFTKHLIKLAGSAGSAFSVLVGDPEPWARAVVRARVTRVVHRGLNETRDKDSLYFLSEILYFLVVLNLMRECGVSESILDGLRRHDRFRHVEAEVPKTTWYRD